MTRLREVVVRATKIDSRTKKARTYDPDRKCEVCGAELSRYNPADKENHRCWIHQTYRYPKYRARHKESAA